MAQVVDDKGKVRAPSSSGASSGASSGKISGISNNFTPNTSYDTSQFGAVYKNNGASPTRIIDGGGSSSYVPEVYIPPIVTSGGVQRPVSFGGSVYTPDVVSEVPEPTYEVGAFQPTGLAASFGADSSSDAVQPIDKIVSNALNPQMWSGRLDEWEAENAQNQGREVTTKNSFGEDYDKDNGFGWFDQQLSLEGNNAVNDAYIRNAMRNGLSYEEAYDIMHPITQFQVQSSAPAGLSGSTSGIDVLPKEGDKTRRSGIQTIDDGSSYDYEHMTADSMTGKQYEFYRDVLGMGGRDNIDKLGIYNKRREMKDYGFKPFTPDSHTYNKMATQDLLDSPRMIGNWLAGMRNNITPDYGIEYDGRKISGRDYDEAAPAYVHNYQYDEKFNPFRFLDPTQKNATPSVREYVVPDVNGQETYHYGSLYRVKQNSDGKTYQLVFTDGSKVNVPAAFVDSNLDENDNVILDSKRVATDKARGLLPQNIDMLNDSFVDQYVIPDADGNETYHYGDVVGEITQNDDGTFNVAFSDGTSVDISEEYLDSIIDENDMVDFDSTPVPVSLVRDKLPDEMVPEDYKTSLLKAAYESGGSPLDYADVLYVPDMIMGDGSRVQLEDVLRLYYDQMGDEEGDQDDDIKYDFSGGPLPFMTNKPSRLMQQELFDTSRENGPFDLTDLGDNLWDWTFGSIPISLPYFSWLYSGSNALRSLQGIEPQAYDGSLGYDWLNAGSYDKDGNYVYGVTGADGSRDDQQSDELRYINALGNLAVPLTERLAGDVGSDPFKKLFHSLNLPESPSLKQVVGHALLDAVGEGIEEVVGGPVEEFTNYGTGMYTDQVLDENGDPMYDVAGHEIRDYDTDLSRRLENALDPNDIANNFLGGLGVDAYMNFFNPMPSENILGRMNSARKNDMIRRQTGVRQYVEPEYDEREEVNPSYLDIFNDRVMS